LIFDTLILDVGETDSIGVGGSKVRGEKLKNVPCYLLFINPTVYQKKKELENIWTEGTEDQGHRKDPLANLDGGMNK
jgi:hypothetical protein